MRRAAVVLLLTLALTGCGGQDEGPPEDVASSLLRVDAAIKDGKHTEAHEALRQLVDATNRAREQGTFHDEQAQRVLAAAAVLSNALPAPPPRVVVSPSPVPAPAPERHERDGGKRGDGKGDGKGDDKDDDD